MRFWRLLVLAIFLTQPLPLCADSSPPTTAPSSADIAALVQQLGAADYQAREQAMQQLYRIGPPALSALHQAAQSEDPEVRSRAESLIKRLEQVPPVVGGDKPRTFAITIRDGARTIDIDEGTRQVQIVEKADGIEMTVTSDREGRQAVQRYKAKDALELRQQQPEAYALYEQYAGVVAAPVGNPARAPVARVPLPPNAFWPAPLDPLEELEEQLHGRMARADVPRETRWKVLKLLNDARNARDADPAMTQQGRDKQVQAFYTYCDELRKVLEELKLADLNQFLPAPARTRLGILLSTKPNDRGLTDVFVQRVMFESRAERLGLKPGDMIWKINDTPIHSPDGLRRALLRHNPPITVTVIRDDKPIELTEPASEAE